MGVADPGVQATRLMSLDVRLGAIKYPGQTFLGTSRISLGVRGWSSQLAHDADAARGRQRIELIAKQEHTSHQSGLSSTLLCTANLRASHLICRIFGSRIARMCT